VSSVGAVKTALVTILGAALPSSQVVSGPIDVTTLKPRTLEVGSTSTPLQFDPSSLDGRSGTELYTLTLTVSVSLPGTDLTDSESLAVADFRAAVAAIRADPSLSLANLNATCTGAGELVESATASGRAAAVRFPVEIFTTF
jgi:hypothetical protein